MRLAIEIPTCVMCNEMMRPVLLVEYPVPAAVWVCTNGCSTLMHGFACEDEIPDEPVQRAFSVMAHKIMEKAATEE